MFGGTYPLINKYSVADSLRDIGYKIQMNKDYTWHYYYVIIIFGYIYMKI